ncbi:MAG: dockerin type I domain-containing protein [Candidatus Aphodosoma sp.]|nr:dockerin type I domain-containing protein [Candidatus Aphodosoma sp.]
MKSVAVSGVIYEPNTVSIDGAWAEDRSAYIANIAVENYTELVAAQMDIHLPVGASINDVANALTNTDRLAGLSSTIAKIDDSTYRIVVFSFNNTHFKGNSGNILSLKIDVGDVYSMANKQILIDNIKLSSANGKDFSSANEATTILPDVAAAEATAFKTAHATILGKTTETVTSSDLPAITAALAAYEELSDAAKAKLVDGEKSLLDALKAKAEEPQYIMGDVNGDGKITAQDLTMLTNRILGTTSPAFVEAAADINGDGKITAQDLPLLTNLILK